MAAHHSGAIALMVRYLLTDARERAEKHIKNPRPAERQVLQYLREAGPQTVANLKAAMPSIQHIPQVLHRLEQHGLVAPQTVVSGERGRRYKCVI